MERLQTLSINNLFYNPDRQRKEIKLETIHDMMKSIDEHGLIEPIVVYIPPGAKPPYEILAGVTRYLACRELKRESIPCRVYDVLLTEYQRKSIELEENIRRINLSNDERDAAISELHRINVEHAKETKEKYTQDDTARIAGVSRKTVGRAIEKTRKPTGRTKEGQNDRPSQSTTPSTQSTPSPNINNLLSEVNNRIALEEAKIRTTQSQPTTRLPRATPSSEPTPPVYNEKGERVYDGLTLEDIGKMVASAQAKATRQPAPIIEKDNTIVLEEAKTPIVQSSINRSVTPSTPPKPITKKLPATSKVNESIRPAGIMGHIDISALYYDENMVDKDMSDEAINDLAESIKVHGLISPLVIYWPDEHPGKRLIIDGIRRFKALQIIGRRVIECRTYNYKLTEQEIGNIRDEANKTFIGSI